MTRRHFLAFTGGIVAGGTALVAGLQSLRYLFPAATQEAPIRFRASVDPSSISVDHPLQLYPQRVAICRDDDGFYAVQLICTHLGCTPNYSSDVVAGTSVKEAIADSHAIRQAAEAIPNGWACPCHGSRYFIDSTNFYGPAPRPMDWVDLQFAPDRQGFIVDRGKLVVQRGAGDTTKPLWRLDPTTGKDNGKTYGV